MKKIFVTLFTGMVLLAGCQNTTDKPANEAKEKTATDSVESFINSMVDEMAPPDSSYTGDFFLKYDNGLMKAKGYFRFGKRHGQWFYYYPNGYLWSEALFENGKMNGANKVYHENGKLYYEGLFKGDLAVGAWNFYDTSGTKIFIRTYDSTGKVLADTPIETPQKETTQKK